MFKNFGNCLLVENLEKSLEFYRDKLGMEIGSQDGKFVSFKGIPFAVFQKDEATAMFSKEHMGSGGGVILAFQVDDLNKAYGELKSKGVEFFEGPKETSWGQKVAYFKDPDENIWEISEPFEEK